MKYDFSGWATKNDLRCSDGRIIRHDAFKECDGRTVPLVWQHMHDSPTNVVGTALLENRPDGVYTYGSFNDTENGQIAKSLVEHGDIRSLSIYANQLQQHGDNVIHGAIREVSLVLAGANPGATIDNLSIVHADGYEDELADEAVIYNGLEDEEPLDLYHADKDDEDEEDDETEESEDEEFDDEDSEDSDEDDEDDEKLEHARTLGDVMDEMTPDQQEAAQEIIALALAQAGIGLGSDEEDEDEEIQHADESAESAEDDSDDLNEDQQSYLRMQYESMTEEQQAAILQTIDEIIKREGGESEDEDDDEEVIEHSDLEDHVMKHNVFDGTGADQGEVLSHAESAAIFSDAKRFGSLKDAVLEHGIDNIDVFFPDVQNVGDYPAMISRPMEWVQGVLSACHKTPFSKVRSIAANITADEARARGYVKGNKKLEEQIGALKRVTEPQTIYKLQKLDRDDIIDITDFNVVAWIKQEMRTMLDEEVARAILVGDGRSVDDESKIKETNIRPIWTDSETYALHTKVSSKLTGEERAEAFIDACIRSRKNYRGSGSPTLYVGTDLLTDMRLIKDKMGHRLYKNDQELADELRVSKIQEIQLLDGLNRTVDGKTLELGGIIVNLTDYNCGSTKGGEVNMFDDFDIEYNKERYLIETRLSGALYVPFSAMVIEFGELDASTTVNYELSEFDTATLGMAEKSTSSSTGSDTGTSGSSTGGTNG